MRFPGTESFRGHRLINEQPKNRFLPFEGSSRAAGMISSERPLISALGAPHLDFSNCAAQIDASSGPATLVNLKNCSTPSKFCVDFHICSNNPRRMDTHSWLTQRIVADSLRG